MQQQQQGRPHSMDMHITFPIPPIPTFPMFPRPSSSSIPLSCNICSSKPDFSDTSHLLTHIASKGHLSTYYRIKVKSVNDDVARQLIDDYDAWYATWDIEGLMSERMSLKEKKRRQKTDARVIQSTQPPVIDSTGQYYGPLRLSNPLLDPSLAMGSEKEQAYVLGSTHLYGLSDFSTSYDQLPPPWLHSPSAFEDSHQASQACEMEKYGNPTIEDEEPFPAYGSPTPAPRTFMRGNDIRLQPSMADAADDDDDNDSHPSEVTKLSEVAKLKGIYWPGMDIFDSATPEMRRMRNQKKSTDVVDKLEAASREIEPTEIVYFAHGPIKREQTITGFPHEDSSPLRPTGFSPPVIVQRPPRKPAARKALAPRDPNVRGRGGRRTRSAVNPRTSAGQENNQTVHTKGTDGPRRSRRTKTQTAASLPATLHNPTEMAYLTAGFSQTSHLGAEDHLVTQHYEQTAAHPTHIWTHAFDLPPSDTQEGAWDFLGQQLGGFLANPLYMGSTHEDGQAVEDDQRTISAPGSDA